MNIESSSVLTGLGGTVGSGLDKIAESVSVGTQIQELLGLMNTAQSSAGTGTDAFSTALLQQIQLLSKAAAPGTDAYTSNVATPAATQDPGAIQALLNKTESLKIPESLNSNGLVNQISSMLQQPDGMQEISVLLGKQLPVAKKQGTEINLDETMQALSDILGRISTVVNDPALSTVSSTASEIPLSLSSENKDQQSNSFTETALNASLDPLLAQQVVGILTKPATVATSVNNTPSAQNTDATTTTAPDDLGTSYQMAQLSSTAAGDVSSGTRGNANQELLSSKQALTTGANQAHSASVDNPTGAFAEKLFSLKNSSLNTDSTNVDSALSSLDLPEKVAKTIEPAIDNALNRVTGDIQQLNRQLGLPDKVELPAMSKNIYSADWNQELGSKILWMSNQNMSSADLKLNPEHLGPISIRIDMQHDQANISFTANNAGVREMLEASIPKLREMLGSQQLNLVDVNVSQQSFSGQQNPQAQNFQQAGDGQRQQPGHDSELAGDAENRIDASINGVTNEIEQSRAIVTNGLVSLYA